MIFGRWSGATVCSPSGEAGFLLQPSPSRGGLGGDGFSYSVTATRLRHPGEGRDPAPCLWLLRFCRDNRLTSLCFFSRHPWRASHFSLLAQREVTKRKGTRVTRPPVGGFAAGGRVLLTGHPWPAAEDARSIARPLRAFSSALRRATRALKSARHSFALDLPGPLGRGEGAEEKARQGGPQDAGQFAVGPWMARQRTSVAHSRSRPSADRALGGALLFGYFLLGKQEKVTRSPGWRVENTGT